MRKNLSESGLLTGKVVSNKMDKSIVVSVERYIKHPIYNKYIKRTAKLMVHDEANSCAEGDLVSIASCRPLSKNKCYKLVGILQSTN